jgi:uncharacterized iron-regulated protein
MLILMMKLNAKTRFPPTLSIYFPPFYLAVLLCLFAMTACSSAATHLLGDPEDPYPLKTKPKIGEIVHLPTGTVISPDKMLAVAGNARIVYVGETHDNPASHRLELQLLQSLSKLHPGRQALAMEMFSRSQQPALDRWVSGKLSEKEFLKESRWHEYWGMNFAYYRDLLNFARDRQIPIIALNAEKSLVEAISSQAPEQMSAAERAQLPQLDLSDPYQRALVAAYFSDHVHGGMNLDSFVRAQTLWDDYMAESVARYLASPAGRDNYLLVIAGANHVSYGFGIPRRAFRRLPASYVLIGGKEIDIPAAMKDRMMNVKLPEFPMPPYDFQVYLAYEKLPKTGVTLGVMFEPSPTGHGLEVNNVVHGSNAERSGLQRGDLLLALDGEALTDSFDLIYAVEQKHPGDHGTLKVERKGQTIHLDVVFQTSGDDHHHGKR